MKRILSVAAWVALGMVFFAFALHLRCAVASQGVGEVFGYDYGSYMRDFRNARWVVYTGFRHPGLGLVLSPVVLAASRVADISPVACDIFLLGVFACIGVVNVGLVKQIAGGLAAVVFLSFGFVWVLAGVPESYPVAMLSLLLVVLYACRCRNGGSWWIWLALVVLCSAVTITNGLKVLVACLLVKRPTGRRLAILAAACGVVCLLGVGFFALRMHLWNAAHPEAQKTLLGALGKTLRWMPSGWDWGWRIRSALVNFLCIPVVPRIDYADVSSPHLPPALAFVWAGALYAVAGVSAWVHRRLLIVRVMAGMFAVDVFIHIVCGWGLAEGWIFCAHWFWMVAILIGLMFNWDESTTGSR